MRSLLRCGHCESIGNLQTLAEILPSGIISIRRSKQYMNGQNETTLVIGDNFEILCGFCQTPVFRRVLNTFNIGTLQITEKSFMAQYQLGTV